eukprot:Polyplicarium_translucidae@DN3355_c0_g1_i3.p1
MAKQSRWRNNPDGETIPMAKQSRWRNNPDGVSQGGLNHARAKTSTGTTGIHLSVIGRCDILSENDVFCLLAATQRFQPPKSHRSFLWFPRSFHVRQGWDRVVLKDSQYEECANVDAFRGTLGNSLRASRTSMPQVHSSGLGVGMDGLDVALPVGTGVVRSKDCEATQCDIH